MDKIDWLEPTAWHAVFAGLGGLVRVLRSGARQHWSDYVVGALIGMFSGMVIYALCKHWGLSEYMTVALTGLGGYSGTPLLDLLANLMRQRTLTLRMGGEGEMPSLSDGQRRSEGGE